MILLRSFVLSALLGLSLAVDMEEIFRWKQLSFDTPQGSSGPDLRSYNAYNSVPMGATHHRGRLFITIPRRRPGIVSTLNVVPLSAMRTTESPPLRPYPSLELNSLDSSLPPEERIVSIYRSRIDSCNRLWFVDVGNYVDEQNRTVLVHPPTIWAIDTNSNSVATRFPFPRDALESGSGTISLAVDIPKESDCEGVFAYVPDLANGRIYVYSQRQKKMWTFNHNYFHMDPHYGDMSIAGLNFQWDDAIFSIALGRRNSRGFRAAFFHPMVSLSEFVVSTEVLRNESLSRREYHGGDFRFLGQRGVNRQSTTHGFDEDTGVLFFAEIGRNAIGCWNTDTAFAPENFGTVKQDRNTFIYPSDLSMDQSGRLWVMTNIFPRFIYERLNPNDYNFRVWSATARKAIQGTVCEQ